MSGGAARRVAGIVLAAGSSTRMGANKLLLELDGEAVVRRAARTASAGGLDPVVVVTGHEHEAVTAQLHGLGVTAVNNAEHAKGTHTSVAAGVASVRGDCDAVVVVLADMPFVTPAMLREVVARYGVAGHNRSRPPPNSRPPLVVSRYGGDVTAPPILYDRALFGELATMDSRCGRAVVRRHLDEAVLVDWPAEASRDLDRPEDYEGALEELERVREGAGPAREELERADEPGGTRGGLGRTLEEATAHG
ncbi:MAG: nucleotidyltransferase family protein [Gemmatimonadota bacterium]|nr:nucleotidyltransferase family protein [Gemmatimonadota bacterium]